MNTQSSGAPSSDPRRLEWTQGDRMRKARQVRQMTLDEMTDALNDEMRPLLTEPVRRSTVAAWERRGARPRYFPRVLEVWAQVTGVPLEWLSETQGSGGETTFRFFPVRSAA